MREFYRRLATLLESRTHLAVATVVRLAGSSPRDEGAKMVIFPDGSVEGTLGGGGLEARVIQDALETLRTRAPALMRYALTDADLGMKCGGSVEVYIEPVHPPDRLLLFGGGHVGKAVAKLAPEVGFSVEVLDDRPEHLAPEDFPPSVLRVRTDASFAEGFSVPGPDDFVLVLTRNADTDADIGGRYAGKCAYVGILGSRKKLAYMRGRILGSGGSESDIARIRCPVGLDIGSDTPAEVAVSIVAELISVRANRRRLAQEEEKEEK